MVNAVQGLRLSMSDIARASEQIRKEHILYVESYPMSAMGPAVRLCDDHMVPQG